jgi:MinD-like ATPase involved in chromosome partitioning or flagellar assembly
MRQDGTGRDAGEVGATGLVAPDEADRRVAQDAAAELDRMGIDPRTVGLDPVVDSPGHPVGRIRGTAPVPTGAWARLLDHPDEPAQPGVQSLVDMAGRPGAHLDQTQSVAPLAPVRGWFEPPLERGRTPSPPVGAPPPQPGVPSGSPLSRPLDRPWWHGPASHRDHNAGRLVASLERVADTVGGGFAAPWRRILRVASAGLVDPGAAAAIQQERRLVARVRARRHEPWIVTFLAGKGGVGTTTTAAGAALVLSSLRTDGAALVDARCGTPSLGLRLAGQPAPTVMMLSPQARQEPLRVRGALGVVDGGPWHGQLARDKVVAVLENLRQSNAFTLVDAGNDMSETGHAVLGRADQVVLVTTTSQDALAGVRIALSRVSQVEPHRLRTIVVAVVCLTSRHRRTVRRLREQLGLAGRRIVAVPFDPLLAAGGRLEPSELRAATWEAFLRLAAHIADPDSPAETESPRSTVGAESGWRAEAIEEDTDRFPVLPP